MERVELGSGVSMVAGESDGRFPFSHALFIEDQTTVLIDTGVGTHRLRGLPCAPDIIINSHFHADHTRGNRLYPTAQVWAPAVDARAIRHREAFVEFAGYARMGRGREEWMLNRVGYVQSPVHRELSGDEELDLGRHRLRLLPTPGHTPGHLAFLLEPEDILFTADIDLTSFGPWYGNPVSDVDRFEESLRSLAEVPARVIVTSHKGVVREGLRDRLESYRKAIDARDHRCLELLDRGPSTVAELAAHWPIHGRQLEPLWLYGTWEQVMLEHHLVRLERRGLVRRDADRYLRASG